MERETIIRHNRHIAILMLGILSSMLSLPVYADTPVEITRKMRKLQYDYDFDQYKRALAEYNTDHERREQEKIRLNQESLRLDAMLQQLQDSRTALKWERDLISNQKHNEQLLTSLRSKEAEFRDQSDAFNGAKDRYNKDVLRLQKEKERLQQEANRLDTEYIRLNAENAWIS